MLDQIKDERRRAAAKKTVDLPVPGYQSLTARYRLLDPLVEGKLIGENVRRSFTGDEERNVYAAIDMLISACEGLYVRTETGELQPVDPDGEGPVRYDQRLADGLGLTTTTAREVVKDVFNGNNTAILAHAYRLSEWMANPTTGGSLGET